MVYSIGGIVINFMPLDIGAAHRMEELLEPPEDLASHGCPCSLLLGTPWGKPLVMVCAQFGIDDPFRQQARELRGSAIGKIIHGFEQQEVARLDRHCYRALVRAAIAWELGGMFW